MWFDSHCHLGYDNMAADAQQRAAAAGVGRMVSVGTDFAHSAAAVATAQGAPDLVWATVGLHPHDAIQGIDGLVGLVDHPGVVGIGECGLDYHYDHSPRDVQRRVFAEQVVLAHRHQLTLVIHTREAWDHTFDVLEAEGTPPRTIFHCFTGGLSEARRALDIGAWLSFSGIITFPRSDDIRAAAALAPLDRVLVETDSPFLAPVPHRGQPNEPAHVVVVGAALAQVRGVDVAEVEEATWIGGHAAFGRRLPSAPKSA